MVGVVDRVVKMAGPCQPTDDANQWTYHITVPGNHPRMSGTFCVSSRSIDGQA